MKSGEVEKSIEQRITELEDQVKVLTEKLSGQHAENKVSIICFSGEWDKLFAAFTIANGALALNQEVHMFFTFWAVSALRRKGKSKTKKTVEQKLLAMMLPKDVEDVPLSKMNFLGLGKIFMKRLMDNKGVDDISVLMNCARELGVYIHLCETSFGLFGFGNDELIQGDDMDKCGVATFLSQAMKSRVVLFI